MKMGKPEIKKEKGREKGLIQTFVHLINIDKSPSTRFLSLFFLFFFFFYFNH